MSIDLKIMRPGKLAGLLNSTRLGEVTSETRVRRNIVRAGLRVGDSTRVNVLGYAAWLVATWHARRGPGAVRPEGLAGYDALRASSAARNRRFSAVADIATYMQQTGGGRRRITPASSASPPTERWSCTRRAQASVAPSMRSLPVTAWRSARGPASGRLGSSSRQRRRAVTRRATCVFR